MTLSEWILENVVSRVLIRMDLTRTGYGGAGLEAVQASFVGYHWDDDGPVFAEFTYTCGEGSSCGHLEFLVETVQKRFAARVSDVAKKWEAAPHRDAVSPWYQHTGGVFRLTNSAQYGGRERSTGLVTSNILVIQHLARIQGVLAGRVSAANGSSDERAVLHTTISRLGSMIQQANKEFGRLTQLS